MAKTKAQEEQEMVWIEAAERFKRGKKCIKNSGVICIYTGGECHKCILDLIKKGEGLVFNP